MILSKEVEVVLNPANVKYYEILGYIIPKYKNKSGKLIYKRGNKIKVKVTDLQKRSNIKVLCKCDICGKERWLNYNTYSDLCENCFQKTNEFKEMVRKTHKGRKCSEETKTKMKENSWTHCDRYDEIRLEISERMSGKNNPMFGKLGKQNPCWNPDLTDEERRKQHCVIGISRWRKKVKERDNQTCQCCGSKNHLEAHHINNFRDFKELRIDINNGITLCFECHNGKNGIHAKYGRLTTKEHLDMFISNFI